MDRLALVGTPAPPQAGVIVHPTSAWERRETLRGEDADAIAAYLRSEVGLGRVRPLDADVTALTVMGALTHFIHREHILPPEPGREGSLR